MEPVELAYSLQELTKSLQPTIFIIGHKIIVKKQRFSTVAKNFCEKNSFELKVRFDKPKAIPGTLKYHTSIPIEEKTLQLKKTSLASNYDLFPKLKKTKNIKKI